MNLDGASVAFIVLDLAREANSAGSIGERDTKLRRIADLLDRAGYAS